MKNIILTGFMGSGKSSVGRALAREMGVDSVDTDAMIVARAGLPIHEIFDRHGEERFREIESEVIEEAASRDNVVIATGGGALLSDVNLRNLKESGAIVYLAAALLEVSESPFDAKYSPHYS